MLLLSTLATSLPALLGTVFQSVKWDSFQMTPLAYSIALLFGFSERLFDMVTWAMESKILKEQKDQQATAKPEDKKPQEAHPAPGGQVDPRTLPTPLPRPPAPPAVLPPGQA